MRGQILIGDVAFGSRSQLEQCRKDVGNEWDEEEIYFVIDELMKDFPSHTVPESSRCRLRQESLFKNEPSKRQSDTGL